MSSNIIFKTPGRTTNYMPISVNTPKQDIMDKYARASFSTANDWPQDSPAAGFYDVRNSDTKLVLLNNQKTWSHLRGKTKAKHESVKKDPYYDWVEKEIELKKNSSSEQSLNPDGSHSPRIRPNPERHLIKTGCSFRNVPDENLNRPSEEYLRLRRKNKSAVPVSRSKCMTGVLDKKEEERLENEILLKYLYAVGKRSTGLQANNEVARPPREYLSSYNLNHPDFNRGQRLFLNELCSMYSVSPLKQSKQDQYIKLFEKQTKGDQKHRLKYRMHGGDNFDLYKKWLANANKHTLPHEVNCGYYKPAGYTSARNLTSKSMINKQVSSSSFSNGSFASNSNILKTRSFERPKTAKSSLGDKKDERTPTPSERKKESDIEN